MTEPDARGLETTASTTGAIDAYNRTIDAYCGFKVATGEHLKETLALDPEMPLALCTKGYFMLLFGKRVLVPKAEAALAAARDAAARTGATPREILHLEALQAWCDGDLIKALAALDRLLIEAPQDLLALKISHYLNFYLGDARQMAASLARASYAWDPDTPGYGYLLGMRAFAQEECGAYAEAEATGRKAIALNPTDIWACHAVAHVMEMQSRHEEGIAWITGLEDQYGDCNNFAYHLWWHRCLCFLEQGEIDRVLAHYDQKVRADQSSETLDLANGVSLLWRLEERGVDVGNRWEELADNSTPNAHDHLMIFNDIHYAMAMAAAGRSGALKEFLESLAKFGSESQATEAGVAGIIGLPLAEAAAAHRKGDFRAVLEQLMPHRRDLIRLGGSHAQRDLFLRMTIDAAARSGETKLALALLSEREALMPESPWGRAKAAELAA